MNKINLFELRREIFHILVGIGFILMIIYVPYAQFILFGILIIGGLLSFLSTQFYIPGLSKCLCLFERECNKNFPGKGVLFFFIGSLLSLQLFNQKIALASILILTFADSVSHFVGSNFGKTALFNKRKYIEGNIFGIIIGSLVASFFVPIYIAFAGCFVAMFIEAVEIAMGGVTIDDNLLIPLVAGTVMHLVSGFL